MFAIVCSLRFFFISSFHFISYVWWKTPSNIWTMLSLLMSLLLLLLLFLFSLSLFFTYIHTVPFVLCVYFKTFFFLGKINKQFIGYVVYDNTGTHKWTYRVYYSFDLASSAMCCGFCRCWCVVGFIVNVWICLYVVSHSLRDSHIRTMNTQSIWLQQLVQFDHWPFSISIWLSIGRHCVLTLELACVFRW